MQNILINHKKDKQPKRKMNKRHEDNMVCRNVKSVQLTNNYYN